MKKNLDLTNIGISLDAAAEQENAECEEEIEEIHPDYIHLDIENLEIKEKSENISNIYRRIGIPDINELKTTTRQLDPFQRNVIDIGIKYAKDILKSQREGNLTPKAPNVMVHGGASAGKDLCNQNLSTVDSAHITKVRRRLSLSICDQNSLHRNSRIINRRNDIALSFWLQF